MPGGIDPHTHMQLPFMDTVTGDNFYTGPAAGLSGGTTMIIDFVIPAPDQRPMDAYRVWQQRAAKAPSDYSFHVAITNWNDRIHEDMGTLTRDHGVNSFKHFMAYKGEIMLDAEKMMHSFARARDLGALCTVHCEDGNLVWMMQQELLKAGVTGAGGPPAVAPAGGRGRGRQPRDPHRPAPQGADLYRPRDLPGGSGGDHAARASKGSASTASAWRSTW